MLSRKKFDWGAFIAIKNYKCQLMDYLRLGTSYELQNSNPHLQHKTLVPPILELLFIMSDEHPGLISWALKIKTNEAFWQPRSQCLSSYHPLELERGWLSDPLVEYSVYIGELYNMMTRTDVEHAQAKGDWWRLRFQPCGLAFITIVIFVNLICESDKLDWFWTLFWSVFRIPEINKNWNSKGTRVET